MLLCLIMYSTSNYIHNNLVRWDLITRFLPKNSYNVPQLNKISLRMHENSTQNYKDRFVLAYILETLGMQRLSNKMILKNKYTKSLTVKRTSTELGVQLTLRKHGVNQFLDTFLFHIIPQSNSVLQYKNLKLSTRGNVSLYCDELYNFPGLPRLATMIHVVPSLQIHISGVFLKNIHLAYILSSYRLPKTSEQSMSDSPLLSYNFFDK